MNKYCPNCSVPLEKAFRKSNRLGVYALDHFVLEVPDLATAALFFPAIGLHTSSLDGGLAVQTDDSSQNWAIILPGSRPLLRRVSFAAYLEDIPALAERAATAGIEARVRTGNRLLLPGPDGIEVEIIARNRGIFEAAAAHKPSPMTGVAPARSKTAVPRPLWLAHIALFTADVPAALKFYTEILGLVLSDRSGDTLAFLHGPHGSDHHILGLLKSGAGGLHHYSWEMGSLDAVGIAASHAAAQGYRAGWGLGRHVLGSNYFQYIRDPWGSYAELIAGIEFIPADAGWVAKDHVAEDAFFLWGPPPPADFAENRQAARQNQHQTAA